MKVRYHDVDTSKTVECGNPEEISAVLKLRCDFGNVCDNYNYFYLSENGDREDPVQLWVEANGNYAYLFYIDNKYQWQSLNDNNDLDPNEETPLIPFDPILFSNRYFVTIETAIEAVSEFCLTKTRPTNIRWEALQEE